MHRVKYDTNYILIYDVHRKGLPFKTQSNYICTYWTLIEPTRSTRVLYCRFCVHVPKWIMVSVNDLGLPEECPRLAWL